VVRGRVQRHVPGAESGRGESDAEPPEVVDVALRIEDRPGRSKDPRQAARVDGDQPAEGRIRSLQSGDVVLASDRDLFEPLHALRQRPPEVRRIRPRVRDRLQEPALQPPLAVRGGLLLESGIEDAAGPHDSHLLRRRYDFTAL